jgi:hypothetical protein
MTLHVMQFLVCVIFMIFIGGNSKQAYRQVYSYVLESCLTCSFSSCFIRKTNSGVLPKTSGNWQVTSPRSSTNLGSLGSSLESRVEASLQ